MSIADKLPSMSDKDLTSLRSNAERLRGAGTARQQEQAGSLLPLIDAEIDARKARAPTPAQRLRRARKA
jgi:hypothetical protein